MMNFEIKIDKIKQTPIYLQIKQNAINMIGPNKPGKGTMMPNVKTVTADREIFMYYGGGAPHMKQHRAKGKFKDEAIFHTY